MHWNEFKAHIRHLSVSDHARIKQAFELGKKVHDGQKRASGDPYFTHPIAVANLLADMGADADTIIAALLHDTVEDTELTLEEIDSQFNGSVSTIIDGVTKIKASELADKPTLDDKIETLRKIFTAMEKDVRIMVVKLVDRLHNMQTIEYFRPEKQQRYAKDTMDVYVKIADRLSMTDLGDELEGLCLNIIDPKWHDREIKRRTADEKSAKKYLQAIQKVIDEAKGPNGEVVYEHKGWSKIKRQLERKPTAIDFHISIVTESEEDCYRLLGILHHMWSRQRLSFQDYINEPTISGYEGLRTTLLMEDGTRMHCLIHTVNMHVYRHEGISSICFDNEAVGIDGYLPWAERLGELTKGKRSEDFWESLQQDILNETIVMYTPEGKSVYLPADATCLDAAFYSYDKEALKAKSIALDGEIVHFALPARNASNISVDMSKRKTVKRSWLESVNTGLATSIIRGALGSGSTKDKLQHGKELIQEELSARNKGFLEEIKTSQVEEAIAQFGVQDLDDLYINIAEGYINATDVVSAIYHIEEEQGKKAYRVRFSSTKKEATVLEHIQGLLGYLGAPADTVCVKNKGKRIHAQLDVKMDSNQKEVLKNSLRRMGITNTLINRRGAKAGFFAGIMLLIAIWALDPVAAHLLLNAHPIGSINMTLVRFWTLAILSGGILAFQYWRSPVTQKRIPIGNPWLWIAGAMMVGVSVFTYESLQSTLPSHYTIPMTATGITLTTIYLRQYVKTVIATWTLLIAGTIALIAMSPEWSYMSILYTLGAIGFFTLFTVMSDKHREQAHIKARFGQYFLVLTTVCSILTLPLIPYSTLTSLPADAIIMMMWFCIVFVGLPYYIYYHLLSYQQVNFALQYSFMLIFFTLIGQWLTIGKMNVPAVLVSSVLIISGALLPLITTKQQS